MKTNKGFTLIELMVVVLIIGILSAFAIPEYTRSLEKARVAEALTIMDALKKGVDLWVAENGFPSTRHYLIGSDAEKQLDIEVASQLNCSREDRCSGSYYNFQAYCESSNCSVMASRSNNSVYNLVMTKNSTTLSWSKLCHWINMEETNPEMGENICKLLEGQGWISLSVDGSF